MTITPEQSFEGIRGWLILILIGLVVTPIRIGLQTYLTFAPILSDGTWEALTSPSSESYHKLWAPLISFEIAGNIAIILLGLITLYFFVTKSRHTPRAAIAWLLTGVAIVVGDFFLADLIPIVAAQPTDADTIKEAARSVISAVIWVPYFLVSKRVKATFVR